MTQPSVIRWSTREELIPMKSNVKFILLRNISIAKPVKYKASTGAILCEIFR
jgi:hypothetical protein